MTQHIGIALSGGVDSTATALLLQQKFGPEKLHGFFMHLAQPDFDKQLQNVQEISDKIDIPLTVIDLQKKFSAKILHYFSESYFCGQTPNPCVVCNKEIKFGLFVEAMFAKGVKKIATGHYAKISANPYRLFMGKDRHKDQSYFLARLSNEQLAKTLFPLGDMEKEEIYQFVEQHGFTHFRGKESQDVCFLENQSVSNFLQKQHQKKITYGKIVDRSGQQRGEHNGFYNYTVGQRKGLGISNPKPLYVVALDPHKNEVIVGEEDELYRQQIMLDELHWIQGSPPENTENLLVKIRSTHKGALATLQIDEKSDTSGRLSFNEAQRAITPGQFAVFYQDDEVLGCGVIL